MPVAYDGANLSGIPDIKTAIIPVDAVVCPRQKTVNTSDLYGSIFSPDHALICASMYSR